VFRGFHLSLKSKTLFLVGGLLLLSIPRFSLSSICLIQPILHFLVHISFPLFLFLSPSSFSLSSSLEGSSFFSELILPVYSLVVVLFIQKSFIRGNELFCSFLLLMSSSEFGSLDSGDSLHLAFHSFL